MIISLHSIRPTFLPAGDSEVWGREIDLPDGCYVNVYAPSGKGKTSFIAILYGLLREYSGGLQFDQMDASHYDRNQWAKMRRRHLSLMFQDLRLFPQLSALDNVLLNAQHTGSPDLEAIEKAFDRLGIKDLLHAPVKTCSQGEKQRIAFIRAMMQPFDWIFLDEPFSHLDEALKQVMRDMLMEISTRNKAGVLLTSLEAEPLLPFDRTYAL